jgi:hypothetical protein
MSARARTYFHCCSGDVDPQRLLDPARQVSELEGRLSDERDLDADAGALLVLPERIAGVEPLDPDLIAAIRARL